MNNSVNAIIIDDEANARENLKILIEDFCPEVHIMATASNADEARYHVENLSPDLVFLDIMMPGEDGFSFLKSLDERKFSIIFTTAHNEFALKAIKESAIDYLEKPIHIEDLQHAVGKACELIELKRSSNLSDDRIAHILENIALNNSVEKTSIPTRSGLAIVKNTEIIHLEANESYTTIYLTENRKYLSSKTIKFYEKNLNDRMFFRTHKSHIINFTHHLKEFNRTEGSMAVMSNDVEIPVSRRKLPLFLNRITNL